MVSGYMVSAPGSQMCYQNSITDEPVPWGKALQRVSRHISYLSLLCKWGV